MNRLFLWSFLLLLLSAGCTREKCEGDLPSAGHLRATVIETSDAGCGRPVLQFENDDTAAVHRISGVNFNQFVVAGLPAELNVKGNKLYVGVKKLPSEEGFFCRTVGFAYPALKVVYARVRD